MAAYTGKEEAVAFSGTECADSDVIFDLRPPGVPIGTVPIFDDASSTS